MKKKIGVLFLLFVGFALFLLIRYIFLKNQNISGRLRVLSSPTASVFVDNVVVGQVPHEEKYKEGEYLVKLIPEENASDTATWQHKVKVYKNTLTVMSVEMGSSDITTAAHVLTVTKMEKNGKKNTGEVYIETEPNGAIIYLDNDEKGVAPAALSEIPKGDHELSIRMPGFFRNTLKINVTAGYRLNAFIKLAADKSQVDALELDEEKDSTGSAQQDSNAKETIRIKDTPTGWLRVREDATINASESGRVNPGDTFDLLEEKTGWYKIEFEKNKTGWVSSEYCTKE